MIQNRMTVFIIFLAVLGGMTMADELPQKKGVYKQVLETKDTGSLRYTLSVPGAVAKGGTVPLVVALHYGGPVSPYYGGGYLQLLVQPALEKLEAVMIAPDCPAGRWENAAGEKAVLALIEHIKTKYKIDEKKIVLTGFSLGGIGTWYLASRHPELFCAAIPVSGMPPQGTVIENLKNVPLYVIHSDADEIFPVAKLRKLIEQVKAKGVEIELDVLNGISHYHTDRFVPALRKTVEWLKKKWGHSPPL